MDCIGISGWVLRQFDVLGVMSSCLVELGRGWRSESQAKLFFARSAIGTGGRHPPRASAELGPGGACSTATAS